jgi:hypothetical protein
VNEKEKVDKTLNEAYWGATIMKNSKVELPFYLVLLFHFLIRT